MGIYNYINKSSSANQLSYFDKAAVLGIQTEETSQRPSDGFLQINKDAETILSERVNVIRYRDLWNLTRMSDTLQTVFNVRGRKTFREGFDIEANHDRANRGQEKDIEGWIKKCNNNGQSLKEVFMELDKDLNWADDSYGLCLKDYGYNDEGDIVVSEVKEFVRLHPLSVELQLDNRRRLGRFDTNNKQNDKKISNIAYFNPFNRLSLTPDARDRKTGRENIQAHYRVSTEQGFMYYNDSEIKHKSAFNPSLTYGYSPLFSLYQKILILMLQDSYMKKYYGDDKPTKGLLVFNTANKTALMKTFDEIRTKTQQNPHGVKPIIAESSDGRKPVEYIDMAKSLDEMQYTNARDELKMAIGAMYGVSPLFQNDMSTGGGLNNEGLQVTVTNEVIQDRQELFNDSYLHFFFKENLGYDDWTVTVKPDIEQDLMAEEQLKAQELANAQIKLGLGLTGRLTKDNEIVFDAGELELDQAAPEPDMGMFNLSKSEVKKADGDLLSTTNEQGHTHDYTSGKDFTQPGGVDQHVHPVKGKKALQGNTDHEHKIISEVGKAEVTDFHKANDKVTLPIEAKELDKKLNVELKEIFNDINVSGKPTKKKMLAAVSKVSVKLEKQLRKSGSSVFKGIYDKVAKETNKQIGSKPELTNQDKETLTALKTDKKYQEAFTNLSVASSMRIQDTILNAFEMDDVSIDNIIKDIELDLEATKGDLRNIVRTETGKIASGARKTQLDKTGAEYKYFHIGPNDNRTTQLSKNIMAKTKNGVSWDEYLTIMKSESKKFFPEWTVNDDFPLSHYQSRHIFNFRRI